MVEGPAAHVGQGHNLDDVVLHVTLDLVRLEHVVEGIKKRPQIGVNLGGDVAGQKAEALAGLDRRANQEDALDRALPQQVDRHAHGQVRFAGAGRADAQDQVVVAHGVDIAGLAVGPWPHVPPRLDDRQVFLPLPIASGFDHGQDGADVFQAQRPLLGKQQPQLLEYPIRLVHLLLSAVDVHQLPARHQADPQRLANHAQMLIAAAEKQERFVAVVQRQGHGCLGAHNLPIPPLAA